MFVPLTHAPGEAQADFGQALAGIGGVECKAHYLAMEVPNSHDCFVIAFPAETTEAFLEGHKRAFAYFSRVPKRILYDNMKIAMTKVLVARTVGRHGRSRICRVTISSPLSPGFQPRATIRARWTSWSGMRGATP
jgi:transposase